MLFCASHLGEHCSCWLISIRLTFTSLLLCVYCRPQALIKTNPMNFRTISHSAIIRFSFYLFPLILTAFGFLYTFEPTKISLLSCVFYRSIFCLPLLLFLFELVLFSSEFLRVWKNPCFFPNCSSKPCLVDDCVLVCCVGLPCFSCKFYSPVVCISYFLTSSLKHHNV